MAGVILAIGVLVFLAHFFTALFQRTRIPDVLLLTLLGIVLGPVTHMVVPEHFGQVGRVMSTLALIVILFESGITIDPDTLAKAVRPTLRLTLPTFAVTLALAYLASVHLLKVPTMTAWMAGAILGGVSAAVVIPLVKSLRVREPLGTALVMESALGDVLCIVLLLGLMEGAAAGAVQPVKILGTILASLLMAGLIGILGGVVWLLVLNKVRQFPNTIFTTLAMVCILYGVADELGFSGAITALAFGATLTNYEHLGLGKLRLFAGRDLASLDQTDVSFVMEVRFLLKTFFFVYLGVSIRFEDLPLVGWAAVFCGAVYLVRVAIARLALMPEDVSWQDMALTSMLAPKGLVAAVLASLPVERGIEGALVVRNFTYMVVLISICLTAVLIPLLDRRPLSWFYRGVFGNKQRVGPEAPVVMDAGRH
ncbi:MAG: cation:proton antiporter [Bryobacterales bacterium]|nr:cation:proton antiporter [Bryobacterales bacterium]